MINNPGPPLVLTLPTGSPTKLTPQTFAAALPAEAPSFTAYVDTAGDDDTGAIGSPFRPFLTIAAALAAGAAAALPFFQVIVSPGAFAMPGVVPAALKTLAIKGSGGFTALVAPDSGTVGFDFGGTTRTGFILQDCSLENQVGEDIIRADGSGQAAGSFFTAGIAITRCELSEGDVTTRLVAGTIEFTSCSLASSFVTHDNVGQAIYTTTRLPSGSEVAITADNDDPLVDYPLDPMLVRQGSSIATIQVGQQGSIDSDASSFITQITDTGLTTGDGGTKESSFNLRGGCGSCTLALVNTANTPALSFSGETWALLALSVQAPSSQRKAPVFSGLAAAATSIRAAAGIDLDARGARSNVALRSTFQTSGGGTIAPPSGVALAAQAAAAPTTTIAIPFTLPGTAYNVAYEADNATALPTAVTGRTASQIQIATTVAAGNIRATIFYV